MTTNKPLNSIDTMEQFITDALVINNDDGYELDLDFLQKYSDDWLKLNGIECQFRIKSNQIHQFINLLRQHGWTNNARITDSNKYIFIGIAISSVSTQ